MYETLRTELETLGISQHDLGIEVKLADAAVSRLFGGERRLSLPEANEIVRVVNRRRAERGAGPLTIGDLFPGSET